MAGLSEGCSHIAAVLFAMENGTRIAKEASVTDVPAYWLFTTPAKFVSSFQRIREMDFTSASKKCRTVTARTLPHICYSPIWHCIPQHTLANRT